MDIYRRVASRFPPYTFCFAYGSGVKKQLGYDDKQRKASMVDLVFCVENAEQWHGQNLAVHPSHYSAMKFLGSHWIAKYQRNLGASVYCNTLIPVPDEGIMIKYGVISEADLLDDLQQWIYLYTAGRLHKPVSIVSLQDGYLKNALESNLQSALRCAMVLLPEKFSKFDLFYTISSMSYKGDFRMVFGENKNKVTNIVEPQMDKFYDLYQRTISKVSEHIHLIDDMHFVQDKSIPAVQDHLKKLPNHLVKTIVFNSRLKGSEMDILHQISSQKNCADTVWKSLKQIVFKSSALQSIKNIPTAGIWKSIVYSWEKAMKTFA